MKVGERTVAELAEAVHRMATGLAEGGRPEAARDCRAIVRADGTVWISTLPLATDPIDFEDGDPVLCRAVELVRRGWEDG